jgi:glycine/D-amino acid oxidase-like deaminating enzyme
MSRLLIVGAGLFGSQAAACARRRGVEALVFDPGREGAASPAAAGLFSEAWAGRRLADHFRRALPLLDRLYGVRSVSLARDDGGRESLLFVPPSAILEPSPLREAATAVGDGWLEAGGRRYEGLVYVAAGVWSEAFCPGLGVYGKAGAAFLFPGERAGRMRPLARGRQALAFVRDPGATYFSDGTAQRDYTPDHDRQTLARAAELGLTGEPAARCWGRRPYVRGGPVFRRLGGRTWLAAGGGTMGVVLGASFARRLIEEAFP